MDDLVISAISIYDFDKIKHWVNSLERTGYTGRKAMIVFNVLDETIEKLHEHGFEIFLVANQRNKDNNGFHFMDNFGYQVPTLRHYFYWKFLKDLKDIRYVISTDVDIVFQSNPSDWLTKNMRDKKLNYGGEGLKYKDEPWGYDNIAQCFGPDVRDHMAETQIYNAGSMAGEFKTFVDYSLTLALMIEGTRNPVPDQAAVNVLLSTEPYKSITNFNSGDSNWACQCGTMVDPSKMDQFRPNLLCNEPIFEDGYVYNSVGERYVMVHQYNRVPEWKKILEEKYA